MFVYKCCKKDHSGKPRDIEVPTPIFRCTFCGEKLTVNYKKSEFEKATVSKVDESIPDYFKKLRERNKYGNRSHF